MTGFQNTRKQRELMELILQSADAGVFPNYGELHAKISYGPVTVGAIEMSCRFLIKHGFVVKQFDERGRMRLQPTPLAYARFRATID